MNDIIRKFCVYLCKDEQSQDEYNELRDISDANNLDFIQNYTTAAKIVEEIRLAAEKMNVKIDFDSFCELLEQFISNKKNLSYEEKKNYLNILVKLSEIYDIDIREELESYNKKEKKDNPFDQTIIAYLNYSLEDLKEEQKKDLSPNKTKSLKILISLKTKTKSLGFDIDIDSFYNLLSKYIEEKKKMNDKEKKEYINLLLSLSKIHKLNLKELIIKESLKNKTTEKKEELNSRRLLKSLSNPLSNELCNKLLKQRYEECNFNIESLVPLTKELAEITQEEKYEIETNLLLKIVRLYVKKIAFNISDVNIPFQNTLSSDDLAELSEINIDILYNIVSKKTIYYTEDLGINENTYYFIKKVHELYALDQTHIYDDKTSLFSSITMPQIEIHIKSAPSKKIYDFISKYIIECIKNKQSHNMEAYNYLTNEIILYSSIEEFTNKIALLNKLNFDYVDYIESFEEVPLYYSKILDSYYGITFYSPEQPYLEYITDILELSYYRTLAKIVINKVNDYDKEILLDFININEYNKKANTFNSREFNEYKDLINRNFPEIKNTFDLYLNREEINLELINEFRKSINYFHNIIQEISKKEETLITLNKELFNYISE